MDRHRRRPRWGGGNSPRRRIGSHGSDVLATDRGRRPCTAARPTGRGRRGPVAANTAGAAAKAGCKKATHRDPFRLQHGTRGSARGGPAARTCPTLELTAAARTCVHALVVVRRRTPLLSPRRATPADAHRRVALTRGMLPLNGPTTESPVRRSVCARNPSPLEQNSTGANAWWRQPTPS